MLRYADSLDEHIAKKRADYEDDDDDDDDDEGAQTERIWPSALCQTEGHTASGQLMAKKNKPSNRQRIKALSNKCAGSQRKERVKSKKKKNKSKRAINNSRLSCRLRAF